MMVGTRSGARRARAQAQAQAEVQAQSPDELIQQDDSSQSSDDDEDIPYTSPRKSVANPKSISLDHRRNRNQRPDHNRFTSSGQFKRRKIGHVANSQDAHPYPTPALSAVTLPVSATRQDGRGSSSPEEAVPAGLINSVNAALKQNDHEEAPKHSESSTYQLMSESNARDNDNDKDDQVNSNNEDTASQELEDDEESLFVSNNEPEESYRPESMLRENSEVKDNSIADQDEEVDIWDVPITPQQLPPPKQPIPTSTSNELRAWDRRISQRLLEAAQTSQTNETHAIEDTRPASQSDDDDLPEVLQLGLEVDAQQEAQENTEDENTLEHIDGLSTDDENLTDIDLSAKESFAQDVSNFRARHPRGYEGIETFEGPLEGDDVAIHIAFDDLKKALKLMGHRAWAGLKGKWYTRSFNCEQSETSPVQALLQFLAKLERLLEEAPKAPRIAEQNLFFRKHGDLLGYYFSKIRLILSHIRERRKENLSRPNDNTKKRDRVSKELVSYAIPMLLHVMASTWCLGGDDLHSSLFTASSIEFLMRILGWIMLLYRPLLRGQQHELLDPARDESQYQKEERLVKRTKQKELEGYLEDLRRAIEFGIDELEREEHQRDQERQDRSRSLERQKELLAQWKREEEEMMRAVEEKQWRSLMSLRGIHVPLSESPIPSPAKGSPMPQLPAPSRGINGWLLEEKKFLFREIQKSYPDLPDLAAYCSDLDRTLEDVETAAEELLGLMLEAVCPDDDAADRAAQIQRMMVDYRLTYGP
ncbi:hypothetical protein F4818DRAFT_409275 [Hypoxylon cercidicola]|nr:hypothetical protein F4818DRAFT_409275 [Hypoxylon cercidicola]